MKLLMCSGELFSRYSAFNMASFRPRLAVLLILLFGGYTESVSAAILAHRYVFSENVNDCAGSLNGTATQSGTYVIAPTYVSDKPSGAVGVNGSISLGASEGSRKSGFSLSPEVFAIPAGSCSFWMKPNHGAQTSVADYVVAGLPLPSGVDARFSGNSNSFAGSVGDGGAFGAQTFQPNANWYHVVLTWNNSTGEACFYVNGALSGTSSLTPGSIAITSTKIGNFSLNDSSNNLDNQYSGLLCDLQFYSGVLSEHEVRTLYDNPGQVSVAGAHLDCGSPYNGPHIVPGTIEGEDFNAGGSYTAYRVTAAGNQGNDKTYRQGTDVDISSDSDGNVYIKTSTTQDSKEWVNYTFEVKMDGWYEIKLKARGVNNAARVATVVNDRAVNESVSIQTGLFRSVTTIPYIYLGSGSHVLKLVFTAYASGCELDSITINSVSPPSGLTARLFESDGEQFVASAVVTESPFNASPMGVSDATTAFQQALNMVGALGGGVVYAPPGKYRIDGTLIVPGQVTLMGDWESPLSGGSGTGTILMAYSGSGTSTGTAFIRLGGSYPTDHNATVRNLSIWYPNQSPTDVVPYPYTLSTYNYNHNGSSVCKVTLYNSYQGIYLESSKHRISDIYGTVLRRGIASGHDQEYSSMQNVYFDNGIWENAPHAAILNAPQTAVERTLLNDYTSQNLEGIQLGANDDYDIYGIHINKAHSWRGLYLEKLPNDSWPLYGVLSKIDASVNFDVDDPYRQADLHTAQTDLVPEANGKSHSFAVLPQPARTGVGSLYNVRDFGAIGDGAADDTLSIQTALDTAATAGGGTVYLPQGAYKILSGLDVPSGVELLGPYGWQVMTGNGETCVLMAYKDRANAGGTPFLTLAADSGLRGVIIAYPEQGCGSPNHPVSAYPATIQGDGIGVWVDCCGLLNSYNGIDLLQNRCDNFLLRNIEITAFNWGIAVGNGSTEGCLEGILSTWGVFSLSLRQNAPMDYEADSLSQYTLDHTTAFMWGHCSGIEGIGLGTFQAHIHSRFYNDGGGTADGLELWHVAAEDSQSAGLLFEAAQTNDLIGVSGGTYHSTWLKTASSFSGVINAMAPMLWQENSQPIDKGGTINIYEEHSLVEGKDSSSGSAVSGCGSGKALDRDPYTEWCSTEQNKWLMVDLGQPSEIERWKIYNAGMNPMESVSRNTRGATLLLSDTGTNFVPYDSFTNNTRNFLDRPFKSGSNAIYPRCRYVKLQIDQGAQNGSSNVACIPELFVYGREGWHFRSDSEGWAANTESTLSIANDRLTHQ